MWTQQCTMHHSTSLWLSSNALNRWISTRAQCPQGIAHMQAQQSIHEVGRHAGLHATVPVAVRRAQAAIYKDVASILQGSRP